MSKNCLLMTSKAVHTAILGSSASATSFLYDGRYNLQIVNVQSGSAILQSKLKGVTDRSGKKQRLHGIAAEGVDFNELHSGGSRTEAARLFFELLVLQSRSKVSSVSLWKFKTWHTLAPASPMYEGDWIPRRGTM
jgi:hypothetical protein